MSKRILYFTSLAGLFMVWVVGQTPQPAVPTPPAPTAPRVLVPPVPGVPNPGVPGAPGNPATPPPADKNATPEANGFSPDGRAPNVPAGQDNRTIKAPNPNDVCPVAFNFKKLNAEALGYLYRQLTGRRVIMSAEVKDLELYFVQPPPITYGEALELLKAACLIHGFVFSPGGDGWDRLSSSAGSVKPPLEPDIPFITSEIALPDSNEVVRYVMALKHVKPDEASRIFQTVLGGQFNAFGSVVAVPNAASLIITDNVSLIRFLIDLQKKIDVPSSDIETKFIKVQYGDVEALATTISELFAAQESSQSTAGVQRVAQPAIPGQAPIPTTGGGAASSNAGEAAPVQILPDLRTNRIFVMARPIDVLFVENLIKQFDVESDSRNFMRRKLKFLPVGDFIDVAGNALTRAFGGSSEGGASSGGGRASTATSTGRGAGSTLGSSMGGARSTFGSSQVGGSNTGFGGNTGGIGGGSSFSGGGLGGGGLSAPDVDTAPVSLLVGRTLLVGDKITNSIVVQGPPAGVEIINNLLDEIDVKADQVMISTCFGQLTLDDTLSYGVDWLRGIQERGDGSFGGTIGSELPTASTFAAAANKGLGIYGTIGNRAEFYLQALQETGKFKVISTPTIFTANNQKGLISSGQQIAVPASTNFYGNTGQPNTNYEYKDVALSLEVIPLVNSEDEVTLQISLVSQDVASTGGQTTSSGDKLPDIINRELLTTVTVPNNQTVVLGGLITENNTSDITGIPLLSQIPGIGKIFSTTTKGKSRNELLIFIQPQIVRDQRGMDASNTRMDNRYELSDDLRDAMEDPSLLPPPIEPVAEKSSNTGSSYSRRASKPAAATSITAPVDTHNAPKARPVKSMADPMR